MSSPPEDLQKILGPGEQVQLYIKQKIYHPKINIDSVALTNVRIILRHPHAMGLMKDYTDFNYQDISNVILDKGVLRSTVKCTLRFGGDPLDLAALPNDDAEKAYGIIRGNLSRYQPPQSGSPVSAPPIQLARPASPSQPFCTKCGAPIVQGQQYCGRCGSPLV